MYILVEPHNEYKKTLEKLNKLDYTPIILFKVVLSSKNQTKENIKKVLELKKKIKPKLSAIQIILQKIENTTIGTINSLKTNFDLTIGLGGLNKTNRYILEQTNIDFLQDPQNSLFQRKIDFIHHLNSGLNHILCKFAQEKNIGLIFSLNFTSNKDKKIIAKEIGRINQNLKFAQKFSIPININFIINSSNQIKTLEQLKGINSLFNISTIQANKSINILKEKIDYNQKIQSNKFITNGIKIL